MRRRRCIGPPLSEFDLLLTSLAIGEREKIRAIGGPSILINVKGEGKMNADGKEYELGEGAIFFVDVVLRWRLWLRVDWRFIERLLSSPYIPSVVFGSALIEHLPTSSTVDCVLQRIDIAPDV